MVPFTVKTAAGRLLSSLLICAGAVRAHTHDVAAVADTGRLPVPSFGSPPAAFRPKFRYWLPDASVTAEALDADIASLAAVGAGGIELLSFYNYGQPPISTDWSVYGFGTPAFAALFQSALNSTARHGAAHGGGMVFDFALGANQAAGVPSPPPPASAASTDEYIKEGRGLAMELVYGTASLPAGETVHALALPKPEVHFNYEPLQGFINAPELWGDSKLVAVLAVQIESRRPSRGGRSTSLAIINETSVVDLTGHVQNGTLADWAVPAAAAAGETGSGWELMAFYQRYTYERSCVSVDGAATWVGNGSWMVDHFSAAGAKKMTDFWDEHLLADNATRALLKQVGEYSWEDSMEMMASLWWTPDFLDRFKQKRGYSAVPYLPVFFQASNLWNNYGPPYNTTYVFSTQASDGGRYTEDYRLTLNEGYQDFLKHYQTWAQGHGLEHSCQPSYNLPLDMAADVPYVGAPELESLGFSESIDNYLQFTGAAHLAGRNTISTEIGAQRIGAYVQTMPALLKLFRDSFAAGVNTLVIHGYPYSGTYPGTTWPGYTPFQFEFGEMWGPRQPAWQHINDTLLFAARNTLVLKTSVPRVDLAFYSWQVPFSARQLRNGPNDLNSAGYTHEYIGAENLVLARSSARKGLLSPGGPAYKALVVFDQQRISPGASAALLEIAAADLPIVVVQSATTAFNRSATTIGMSGQGTVSANLQQLFNGSFARVKAVSHAEFTTSMLAAAGIVPRVRVDAVSGGLEGNASQLYTHWRSDVANKTEFAYILNRGPGATFTLSFAVSNQSVPYALDAWTGEQSPLLVYSHAVDGRLVANVTLSQEQSTILAFVEEGTETNTGPRVSVVSHSTNVVKVSLGQDGHLDVLVRDGSEASLRLSNGSTVTVPALSSARNSSAPAAFSLGPWHLSVESYAAPTTLTTASVAANKTTIALPLPLAQLAPWTQIRGLERVSGLGTYTAIFKLPVAATNSSNGLDRANGYNSTTNSTTHTTSETTTYTLHVTGHIAHTLRAFVNGVAVPAFDPAATTSNDRDHSGGRDIAPLLRGAGQDNEIRIEVASSLFNAVKARSSEVRSVGLGTRVPRYYTEGAWAEFGLVGDVVVRQWRQATIV